MIYLLRHTEIDQNQWDACLQKAGQPLVYAQAWYLNSMCGKEWEALVEIQHGEYVSLFPLPVRKWLGQKRVYQPLFTQQLGLFTTPASQATDPQVYLSLVAAHYQAVEYQLPWPDSLAPVLPDFWQWRTRPNYELSLAVPYAVLRQNYSTNLRRNVKKAAAAPLSLQQVTTITGLISLFRQTKGKEVPGLGNRHYQKLAFLYEQARQAGVGQVVEVRRQGELVAAAFLLHTTNRLTFLFGASSGQGRQDNAMAFLLDQLLQQEAHTGKTFDFEGSEVPGVAKFYASFGALPVPYLSLRFNSNSTPFQWTLNVFTSLAKRLR